MPARRNQRHCLFQVISHGFGCPSQLAGCEKAETIFFVAVECGSDFPGQRELTFIIPRGLGDGWTWADYRLYHICHVMSWQEAHTTETITTGSQCLHYDRTERSPQERVWRRPISA